MEFLPAFPTWETHAKYSNFFHLPVNNRISEKVGKKYEKITKDFCTMNIKMIAQSFYFILNTFFRCFFFFFC